MKVSDQNSPIQLNAYVNQLQQQKKPDASNGSTPAKPGAADKVELSDQAKQVQQLTQDVSKSSDVREDKVREIKMAIEKGTYNVSGNRLANNMMNEAIENNVILNKINTKA